MASLSERGCTLVGTDADLLLDTMSPMIVALPADVFEDHNCVTVPVSWPAVAAFSVHVALTGMLSVVRDVKVTPPPAPIGPLVFGNDTWPIKNEPLTVSPDWVRMNVAGRFVPTPNDPQMFDSTKMPDAVHERTR